MIGPARRLFARPCLTKALAPHQRMDQLRHRRIVELFGEAIELDPTKREAFVRSACGDDEEMAGEVRAMLVADEGGPHMLDGSALAGLGHDPLAALALPCAFGEFELREVVGQGAMGTVFRARQRQPDRDVAVKLMAAMMFSAEARARFALEAELLGRLNHPGIARVFASGMRAVHGGASQRPFIAMELVEGQRLDEFVERPGIRLHDRVELLIQIADAVHHAHHKGVLHRDLKPGNILVTAEGRAVVLDFGLGRLLEAEGQRNPDTGSTQVGAMLGTLDYMSPEQVEGDPERIDTRSDGYALGAVAYELLCGRRPLELDGLNVIAAAEKILAVEPKPLGAVDPALRGDLETIVAKAMHKDPELRYDSAEAFASDLRRHLRREPVAARRPTVGYRFRRFIARNPAWSTSIALTSLAVVMATVSSIGWALDAEASARDARQARRDIEKANANVVEALARAEAQAKTNAQVIGSIEVMFSQLLRGGTAVDDLTVRELVHSGRVGLAEAVPTDTPVGARLQLFFANLLIALGEPELAQDALAELLPALDRLKPVDGVDTRAAKQALERASGMAGQDGVADLQKVLARARGGRRNLLADLSRRNASVARARQEWKLAVWAEVADLYEAMAGPTAGMAAELFDAVADTHLRLGEQGQAALLRARAERIRRSKAIDGRR